MAGDLNRTSAPTQDTPLWVYFVALLPSTLLVFLAYMQPWVAPSFLFRDVFIVAEEARDGCCHNYFGLFSNIGTFIWCGTGFILLFSGLVLFRMFGFVKETAFLVFAGLLTGVLAVDDFFMIHEWLQTYAFDGSEKILFSFYAIITLFYLFAFRRLIAALDLYVLGISLLLFAVSVMIDLAVPDEKSATRIVIEDGPKFVAITAWATFQIRASWIMLFAAARRLAHSKDDYGGKAAPARW